MGTPISTKKPAAVGNHHPVRRPSDSSTRNPRAEIDRWTQRAREARSQEMDQMAQYMQLSSAEGGHGWHVTLARKARDRNIDPEVIQRYLMGIDQRLDEEAYPTNDPKKGFAKYKKGHRYMARYHDKNPQSAGHREFSEQLSLAQIGIKTPSNHQKKLWNAFRLVMAEEGDSSAINSWDGQIVTLGAGFGGKYGQADKVLAGLPPTYRARLYSIGIYAAPGQPIKFLDARRGRVYSGNAAWKRIKAQPRMLRYLVALSQSDDAIGRGSGRTTMRAAMVRSQFDLFYKHNARLMKMRHGKGAMNTMLLAIKLHHWLAGVYNWDEISTMPKGFSKAMRWAKRKLEDSGRQSKVGQLGNMWRFRKLKDAKAFEAYVAEQWGR